MLPASQSAAYWNHYMNFVRNPLGSVEVNAFANSFPGSNTSTPLQGSNNVPSIPVNLESDAEHSVQDMAALSDGTVTLDGVLFSDDSRHLSAH